ncbi:MAG: ABC transporter substrate-binding protein [Spirochaetaceae bacterium]
MVRFGDYVRVRRGSTLAIGILALALLGLAACTPDETRLPAGESKAPSVGSPEEETSGTALRVGFSQVENANPWRIAQTISLLEEADARGIELVYADAEGRTDKQLEDVKYLLAQDIDYLIFDPREYIESAPALEFAKEAGVPVILIDRAVLGEAGVDYLTRIATDFTMEGRRAAEWLIEHHGDAPLQIVEITGTPGSSAAIDRQQGFRSVIDQYPEHTVSVSATADFLRAESQRVMEHIIQSTSGQFDAVFAHNDEMAIGVTQALKNAGIQPGHDVIVVGIDGARDAVKAIIAGEMGATVIVNPYYGPVTFDVIERIDAGEEVPEFILIEDGVIDATNAQEMINQAF